MGEKKIKKVVEIDYSKMPEHIWEKQLKEFVDLMNDIEQRLGLAERALGRLMKQ